MHVAGSGRWVGNNVLGAGESCTCVGPEKKKGKERKEKKRESGSDAMNIAGLIKQNFQTALSLNQSNSGLPEL
jgi:hypothetical protein